MKKLLTIFIASTVITLIGAFLKITHYVENVYTEIFIAIGLLLYVYFFVALFLLLKAKGVQKA